MCLENGCMWVSQHVCSLFQVMKHLNWFVYIYMYQPKKLTGKNALVYKALVDIRHYSHVVSVLVGSFSVTLVHMLRHTFRGRNNYKISGSQQD